jgi:diphthamide synthase (EF-2-diphthine--ammonia ligase)
LKQPRPKALISWSSGKDSAFALHEVRRAGEFDVVGALTTVTEAFDRVSIHGVRQEILRAQLDAAGLPSRIVPIPYPCPNAIYEARMGEAVAGAVREGITHIIFGDLFLADIKAYREQKLNGTGITPLFPLWMRPTLPLAHAISQPSTGRSYPRNLPGANSICNCSTTCLPASTLVARTASFTPASWRGRFFRAGFP